jgi:spore coat protein CotH
VDVDDASLPLRLAYSADGRRLVTGAGSRTAFYDIYAIRRIDLTFAQANWWSQMTANYSSETEIPASLSYNGTALASAVGVRFKGDTSYNQNKTEKKSFNISIDYENPDQTLEGYKNLNLNCAWGDNAFMREIVYEAVNQAYVPAVANNYVDLYINGSSWGLYVSSQQEDDEFIKEWFLTNNGTRWRAQPSSGGGQGFGQGKSGLNYLGSSSASYEPYYTLKDANKETPWTDLVEVCTSLNATTTGANTDVEADLDVDRALWFLACENVFDDEDSYIYKGGNDYYVYWEVETGRITPLEYDGNSCLESNYATWSPFYNATNANYPLLTKLLAVPRFRQRYLAHLRTILAERFNPTSMNARIDEVAGLIDSAIQADPKKFMTYAQFQSAVTTLKSIVKKRYDSLSANSEVAVTGLTISDAQWSVDGVAWALPNSLQSVTVTAKVAGEAGIDSVRLYGCTGVVGAFSSLQMYDDGAHGDGGSGDGVYGCAIPAQAAGTRVRFYIETVASNTAGTRTYEPAGAEHDVYVYIVQ